MIFSDFTITKTSNLTSFKTTSPIEDVKKILFFKDNSSGSFRKKEFRWSFDNNYWSSWESLNQNNLSSVNIRNNKYLFLEIRYLASNTNSSITEFSVSIQNQKHDFTDYNNMYIY